jgi:5-aminovalerate/4-aminobutyrate aminotransferase
MKRLRALCDQHGILLIADEVQTGAGRTGTFFAMEQMGVAPDLTTFAKSIAGGFPLAGVCGKAEYMDAIARAAWAAPTPVADRLRRGPGRDRSVRRREPAGPLQGCRRAPDHWPAEIQAKYPIIGDVRGLGSMIAVEVFEKAPTPRTLPLLARLWPRRVTRA